MMFIEILGSGKAYINADEISRLYVMNLGETESEKKSGRNAIAVARIKGDDNTQIPLFKGNANECSWFIMELVQKLNRGN